MNRKRNLKPIFRRTVSLSLVFALICLFCSCFKANNDFNGTRFSTTHHISVSVEALNGTSSEEMHIIANRIHDNVLKDCNIDITFIDSSETSLYSRMTPDISFSYDANQITTYYKMNSVMNLAPYLKEHSSIISKLTEYLGETNIYSSTSDPSEVWYLAVRNNDVGTRVTFIRKDWLDLLGLNTPSDIEELHTCLVAFKDNAQKLLGDNDDNMIPFFIDNDPSVSAKPLFDSQYDTSINDKEFFIHGYNRATQDGFKEGLNTLNKWYIEGLLPENFDKIRPLTKESYEPIENGYVGAFCAKYDYLYINGKNSHIEALKSKCGEKAEYIAVNCFKNSQGEYTFWQEDYLESKNKQIYFPSTCKDPLACLIYLNWLSDSVNIKDIQDLLPENTENNMLLDRYLLVSTGSNKEIDKRFQSSADKALNTALHVKTIQKGFKCFRYGSKHLKYVKSTIDYESVYTKSTGEFACKTIRSESGAFETNYKDSYDAYLKNGAYYIQEFRENEWKKVYEEHNMRPW